LSGCSLDLPPPVTGRVGVLVLEAQLGPAGRPRTDVASNVIRYDLNMMYYVLDSGVGNRTKARAEERRW
jgi:hypothetical protein